MALARGDRLRLVAELVPGEHRAEHLFLEDLVVRSGAGQQCRPVVQLAEGMSPASEERLRPVRKRALHVAPHSLLLAGMDEGADAGGEVAGVADRELAGLGPDLREQRLRGPRLDQDPGPGEADLPGVDVLAGDGAGGGVQIRVGED